MYQIEFLSVAQQDLVDIVGYISRDLSNPEAAEKLIERISKAVDSLKTFPYANAVYNPAGQLELEYRRIMMGKYVLFYSVHELDKLVVITRVVFNGQKYDKLLG